MYASVLSQAKVFLITVLTGLFIGFIYDFLRIIRIFIKHGNFFTQFEDAIYWIIVSFVMFYIMLDKNYGEIRAFSVLGAFSGMVLYMLLISSFVMKTSKAIIHLIAGFIKALIHIILIPVKFILHILNYPYQKIKFLLDMLKKNISRRKRRINLSTKKMKNDLKVIFKKI